MIVTVGENAPGLISSVPFGRCSLISQQAYRSRLQRTRGHTLLQQSLHCWPVNTYERCLPF